MLSKRELGRYHRQIILPNFGQKGQERLKNSHIVIAGMGGLGCLSSIYLARAGVGHITIVDHDHVELPDLNRQILYQDEDIGERKVYSAQRELMKINPEIEVTPLFEKISKKNVSDVAQGVQVVVDGLDNFETRFLINAACFKKDIPFIYGGVDGFDGAITTLMPGKTPCLACIFKKSPRKKKYFLPIFGFAPGFIASMQSMETVKLLANIGVPLAGKLLLFNGKTGEFLLSGVSKDENCTVCRKE